MILLCFFEFACWCCFWQHWLNLISLKIPSFMLIRLFGDYPTGFIYTECIYSLIHYLIKPLYASAVVKNWWKQLFSIINKKKYKLWCLSKREKKKYLSYYLFLIDSNYLMNYKWLIIRFLSCWLQIWIALECLTIADPICFIIFCLFFDEK